MPERAIDTPVGRLTVSERNGAITKVNWRSGADDDTALLREAETQLQAYFEGTRNGFDLPLAVEANPTQRAICDAIAAIPYGQTRTYGQIAKDLDLPAQAIGQGCGANPVPILIPCHRVTGTGHMGGFSGGTGAETKAWLLRHEGALLI